MINSTYTSAFGAKIQLALAQINPKCGSIGANAELIYATYAKEAEAGAELVICPESCLTGYPNEDLVLNHFFMQKVDAATKTLVERILSSGYQASVIFGAPRRENGEIYNSAFLIDPLTQSVSVVDKYELPNYGVFDEKRIYSPSKNVQPIDWRGLKIGLMICEDAWFPTVSKVLKDNGANFLISINGSPYETNKLNVRHAVVKKRVSETNLPFIYVNLVGGQDEIVFDGGSFFYNGETFQAPLFCESTYRVQFEVKIVWADALVASEIRDAYNWNRELGNIYVALVMGLRDYMRKQGFTSAVLGYSGGVDSGLVAAIACDAIGPENVHLVRLPSKYSSQGSLDDAQAGADRLGAVMRTIPIEPVVEALRVSYSTAVYAADGHKSKEIQKALGDDKINFLSPARVLTGTADENIQARARGTILMAISNQEGHILLTTGNKSEVGVGYSTLYGDMSGGFNPVKDCYKTLVWDLCRWRNEKKFHVESHYNLISPYVNTFLGNDNEVVPLEIINKPPSAELRPDQQDEDSLPPYPLLDRLLIGIVDKDYSDEEMVADLAVWAALPVPMTDVELVSTGPDTLPKLTAKPSAVVVHAIAKYNAMTDVEVAEIVNKIRRLVVFSEYKRRQAAPGIKISSKIHGKDRRVPIVNGMLEA